MKKIFSFSASLILLLLSPLYIHSTSYAADVRTDDTILITEREQNLSDLYLFGQTINVEAPVENDLVAAGGDISIDSVVSGNINVAGGNLRIDTDTAGSIRAAGGNIIIDGQIGRDLIIAGGNVTIARSAVVTGDLLIAGGDLNILGRVNGDVKASGGNVQLNGPVRGDVRANAGQVMLGSGAEIGGDLIYSAPQRAEIAGGASVAGQQRFSRVEGQKDAAQQAGNFLTAFSIYKLIADIIISLALIYLFGAFIRRTMHSIAGSPLKNGAYGLAFLILVPILSLFLLLLLYLGVAMFLFYFLILVVSIYIGKVFLGWIILRWWMRRDKKDYMLDWKAAVLGPIIFFVVALIPVFGWLVLFVIYLIAIGALVQQLALAAQSHRLAAPPPSKKKK